MGGDGYYPYLIERGYIDVVVDVRGAGNSGGDFSLFGPRERQDGVELARWAARLPGSNGRVGMAGSSYLGLNQIFTAALAGRHSPDQGDPSGQRQAATSTETWPSGAASPTPSSRRCGRGCEPR